MVRSVARTFRIAFVVGLLIGASEVSADGANGVAAPVSIESFGLHVHSLARGGAWPAVPFGFIRLWDTHTTWKHLEPERGVWQFDALDAYVAAAEERGVRVLLTLGQTPGWAASKPDEKAPVGPGASSPPRDLEDWRRYVATLAARYKGRVRHWEIWNEVNVTHFWSGPFAKLATMERIAAAELKAADSKNVVLSPSVQGGAYRQLDQYFAAGGGRHSDVVSYHFYAPAGNPEDVPERIRTVREVMRKHGMEAKPIWNTETGWLMANRDGGYGPQQRPAWSKWRKLAYDEGAGVVMRTFLLNFAFGVDHVFWYAWDNRAMGLAENMGRDPKDAARGYARAAEWLVGALFHGCAASNGVWICTISRADVRQYIVWSLERQAFTVPTGWAVSEAIGLNGAASPLGRERTWQIGPEPTLVR